MTLNPVENSVWARNQFVVLVYGTSKLPIHSLLIGSSSVKHTQPVDLIMQSCTSHPFSHRV